MNIEASLLLLIGFCLVGAVLHVFLGIHRQRNLAIGLLFYLAWVAALFVLGLTFPLALKWLLAIFVLMALVGYFVKPTAERKTLVLAKESMFLAFWVSALPLIIHFRLADGVF